MELSIIIPAYNEEKRIERTLEEYYKFFRDKKKEKKIKNFEIIVVLNACRDNTLGVVKKFQKKFKNIKFLNFEKGGKGFAIIEGFKDTLKRHNDLIGFVDADMATSPEAFYDLIKNIHNHDGIIASRWLKDSVIKIKQTILRRIMSRSFNFIIRCFFLMHYKDTQCGAKLFKKESLELIVNKLGVTEWAFDIDLLYQCKKNKLKIKEIPTIWEDKTKSKIDIMKVPIQMFFGILRLRLINSFFEPILRPVKFILRIGNRLLK